MLILVLFFGKSKVQTSEIRGLHGPGGALKVGEVWGRGPWGCTAVPPSQARKIRAILNLASVPVPPHSHPRVPRWAMDFRLGASNLFFRFMRLCWPENWIIGA